MKSVKIMLLIGLFAIQLPVANAQAIGQQVYTNQQGNQQQQNALEKIAKYLLTLGAFMGFNLEDPQATINPEATTNNKLLNPSETQVSGIYLVNSMLGALPVTELAQMNNFFPPNNPILNTLNSLANYTFTFQKYNSPGARAQGNIAASMLVDQSPKVRFQNDPVSQSVINLLTMPAYQDCQKDCNNISNLEFLQNLIGNLPSVKNYYSIPYNQDIVGQLNANTLLSPMLYNTQGSTSKADKEKGLQARNQAQAAQNFILYASGLAMPSPVISKDAYAKLVEQIKDKKKLKQSKQAEVTLKNYMANLRVYAAQTSAGMGNLYYMLSKRLPQDLGGKQQQSQALSEYKMATSRLYIPTDEGRDLSQPGSGTPNKAWINKLNNASSATVQKEIAILLAEINYQMYLNRQQQERMLLTSTLMMLQNSKAAQPKVPDQYS